MRILNLIKVLPLSLLLFSGSFQAQASMVENGFDAARQGDVSGALKFWENRAAKGDGQAQFNLAMMYHGGLGVEQSETVALKWYHEAAKNNYTWAQEYLAIGYQEGWFGLNRDKGKSVYWYKQLSGKTF